MQALARVWRDGQKKDCESYSRSCTTELSLILSPSCAGFVYRFVATGTVEEKSEPESPSPSHFDTSADLSLGFNSLPTPIAQAEPLFLCRRRQGGHRAPLHGRQPSSAVPVQGGGLRGGFSSSLLSVPSAKADDPACPLNRRTTSSSASAAREASRASKLPRCCTVIRARKSPLSTFSSRVAS